MKDKEDWSCPSCKGELVREESSTIYNCVDCDKSFIIREI